jgi:glycosyltransferase involved in cell wall biosynthesis
MISSLMLATRSNMARPRKPGRAHSIPMPHISIGILVWNEEVSLGAAIESLFRQSLFAVLGAQNLTCEIVCVANGCTDKTAAIASKLFREHARDPLIQKVVSSRVVEIPERGKANAWNLFVHALALKEAKYLFLMDGDIVLLKPDTLLNMYGALRERPEASVAVDQPIKDISFKPWKSVVDNISLTTSLMTHADGTQLTGQLYCIRAEVARNIYLPRGVLVDDGFIKTAVCTDFLTKPSDSRRIVQAGEAAHVFQAYTSPGAILRNQKRQMIGQTILHVLLDNETHGLTHLDRPNFGASFRARDEEDPDWLKRLVAGHLQETKYFWRLFPGALSFRFQRLAKMGGLAWLLCLPAALTGFVVTVLSCWLAHRALKRGCTDYWPHNKRSGVRGASPDDQGPEPAVLGRTATQH